MDEYYSELVWDSKEEVFKFVSGPSENSVRKSIQDVINKAKTLSQHEQLRTILDYLNDEGAVSRVIDVFFPIPLDNDKVQFAIFDTPGTDSTDDRHQEILKDALSEQTHSILIYVAYSKGIKGSGNRTLLKFLKQEEEKENKSTIDLGRSLFVINAADDIVGGEKPYKDIINADIENEEVGVKIRLSDKKLLFTSAKYGYAAKAVKNGIATDEEEYFVDEGQKILNEKFGRYYRHNRVATSEFSTSAMIRRSDEGIDATDDNAEKLWIASGLYALAGEICNYGEKYASAVKAYSIIDGVDKALARLNRDAMSLEEQNNADIEAVDTEIHNLREAISTSISNAMTKYSISEVDDIPEGVLVGLKLDGRSINTFIQAPVKSRLEELLKGWFFGLFKKKFSEADKSKVETIVQTVLNDYTDEFKKLRKKSLENVRDNFVRDVKASIKKNGRLTEEAKKFVLDIELPAVDEFRDSYEFGCLYEKNKITKKVLFVDKEYVDKENCKRDIELKLSEITGKLSDSYKKAYCENLASILAKVEAEFVNNMEKYSVGLKAKLEDRDAMEQLKLKIQEAASELLVCQNKLNQVIWNEVDYE
jgi:hypothetical protein